MKCSSQCSLKVMTICYWKWWLPAWHSFTEGQNFHLMKKYSGKTDEESPVEQTTFQRWCLFSPSWASTETRTLRPGLSLAGALWVFFLPWHWPTSLLAAVLRIPLKGSSWGFWWLTGNWYTDNPIHFPTLKCYFSFYELVPQLYKRVLEIETQYVNLGRT